jgi:hypothetical protein
LNKKVTISSQISFIQLIISITYLSHLPNKVSKLLVAYCKVQSMSQQLLEQEMTITQILRTYGKRFRQIRGQYSDGLDGRCAVGVIMSYYGWNGKDDPDAARRLLAALIALRRVGISDDLIVLNDSGSTFDEIADFLDRKYELTAG